MQTPVIYPYSLLLDILFEILFGSPLIAFASFRLCHYLKSAA
jgi:hypothetical protein